MRREKKGQGKERAERRKGREKKGQGKEIGGEKKKRKHEAR